MNKEEEGSGGVKRGRRRGNVSVTQGIRMDELPLTVWGGGISVKKVA